MIADGRFLNQLGQLLQLGNGFCAFQLHQFAIVTHFSPSDAIVGHQEPNEVIIPQAHHKGGAIHLIATGVAGGQMATMLKDSRESLEAHHEIPNKLAVLIGKSQKHGLSSDRQPLF
jgi:hypothetical protein